MSVGRDVVVTDSDALIVMLRLAVFVLPCESVTFTVKVAVPLAVGVPLITPVADKPNPAGRLPEALAQV
jgi:hypothetical protein